jgi:two-component system response regulator GlrR
MRQTTILLIDCSPCERVGEALETMLAESQLEGPIRREIVADLSQIKLDREWFGAADAGASLIFLILPRDEFAAGGALIQSMQRLKPESAVIAVIEECGPSETLDLLQMGASDFITRPLRVSDVLPRTWRLLNQLHGRGIVHSLKEKIGLKLLVGETESFLTQLKKIPLIARCDSRVLITGETGTGKEMCARAIHYLSPRTAQPFVPVNCGAIPIDLVENELFGHERGAFTGANAAKPGIIEEAKEGTLFLDEIDCLPLMAQVKLLRFIQEKEYRKLGSSRVCHADVRLIVASNISLEEAMRQGLLRQDLYYRLNVVSITMPPLRERREDMPLLAHHFLEKYADKFRKNVRTIAAEAVQKLMYHNWPGNIRELEHTIERAVIFCETSSLGERDIVLPVPAQQAAESFQQAKARMIAHFEKEYVQRLLLCNDGNISRAAQAAHKNRRSFWELIRKHHIDVHHFKMGASR